MLANLFEAVCNYAPVLVQVKASGRPRDTQKAKPAPSALEAAASEEAAAEGVQAPEDGTRLWQRWTTQVRHQQGWAAGPICSIRVASSVAYSTQVQATSPDEGLFRTASGDSIRFREVLSHSSAALLPTALLNVQVQAFNSSLFRFEEALTGCLLHRAGAAVQSRLGGVI